MYKSRVVFSSVLAVLGTWMATSAAYATDAVMTHAEHLDELKKAEAAGIPQLDPTYYPSQVFWLAIFFLLMYVLMARVALPSVSRIVEGRDDKVRHDLETAHRLRAEAADIEILYNRTLRDADEEGATHISRLVSELKAKQETGLRETQLRLTQKISDTEATLADQKDAAIKEVSAVAKNVSGLMLGKLKKA